MWHEHDPVKHTGIGWIPDLMFAFYEPAARW
jgi:hypothetical protein